MEKKENFPISEYQDFGARVFLSGGLFLALAFSTTLFAAFLALSRCFSAQANSKDKIKRPAKVTKIPGPGKGIRISPIAKTTKPMTVMTILRTSFAILFISKF